MLPAYLELSVDKRGLEPEAVHERLGAQAVDPPHGVVGLRELPPPHRHVKRVPPRKGVAAMGGCGRRTASGGLNGPTIQLRGSLKVRGAAARRRVRHE